MKIKKIGFIILIVIGSIVTLSILSHFIVSYINADTDKKLPESYKKNYFTATELNHDLNYFKNLLARVHPAPIPSFPLKDIETELQKMQKSINQPLTRMEFYRQFAPIVNSINNEHVMLFPPESNNTETDRVFPFKVQFINNRLFIEKNLSSEKKIESGMEIISINGIQGKEIRTILMAYYAGRDNAQKIAFLQNHFHEALASIYDFKNSFEIVVKDTNTGSNINYIVQGKTIPINEEKDFYFEIINSDTILFTYNNFDDKNNSFTPFLIKLFTTVKEKNIKNLIIDIRQNRGGASAYGDEILTYLTDKPFLQFTRSDITISKEIKSSFISYIPGFIRWFPIQYLHPLLKPIWMENEGETASIDFDPVEPKENRLRFTGDVYLLIGPNVMSSASLFAATIKKYNIGILVGENSGGYATHYGNVVDIYLPNTGLKVTMPTSVNYGNSTGPIEPNRIVPQSVSDLKDNKDSVLEYVMNIIIKNQ